MATAAAAVATKATAASVAVILFNCFCHCCILSLYAIRFRCGIEEQRAQERVRDSIDCANKKKLSASLCVFLCMPSPFKIRQTFVIRSLLPMQILQLHRDQTMLAHFYYYYYCDEFCFIRIYIECLSLSLCSLIWMRLSFRAALTFYGERIFFVDAGMTALVHLMVPFACSGDTSAKRTQTFNVWKPEQNNG